MGQLEYVETQPTNILANASFGFPIGHADVVWTADQYWDIFDNHAVYDQGVLETKFFLRQQGMGGDLGEEYTAAINIIEIVCGAGPADGLQLRWGNKVSPYFKTVGWHYWFFTAGGDLTEFQIVSCPTGAHDSYLKIDQCFLYEEEWIGYIANSFGYKFWPGLYGQNYDRGGGRTTPFYAQRRGKTRIYIEHET